VRALLARSAHENRGRAIYPLPLVRLESWIRPAGGSPVPVGAGAPGSRPQSRGEIPAAKQGVESLFGGNKRAGCDCSLDKFTMGEPSRSCHGEGHVRQSMLRTRHGGSPRGTGSWTRARSDHGTRETRLPGLVSEDRSCQPMVKSSGGQRESEGVVVVRSGVQKNAPGAKDPRFDRVGRGCKRKGMAGETGPNHPAGHKPGERGSSHMALVEAPRVAEARGTRSWLWAVAKCSQRSSRCASWPRWGDSPWAASPYVLCSARVATPGRSSVSRVRENRTHGLKRESGTGLA
jgi:hypothetical protein